MLSGSEQTAQQAQQAWWPRVATSIRAKLLSLDESSLSYGDALVIAEGCGVSGFTVPFRTLTLRSALGLARDASIHNRRSTQRGGILPGLG